MKKSQWQLSRLVKWAASNIALLVIAVGLVNFETRGQAFNSIVPITTQASTKNTGEKPQSKVWMYNNQWWAVFPNSNGTFIWRLDGSSWVTALKISNNTTTKADCKPLGAVCHILLWKKSDSPSQLISVEYVQSTNNYKLWSSRPSTTYITLDAGTETGTIDIDGTGRMWLASDGTNDIRVRWSDPPYTSFSAPIVLASGVKDDDICVVTNLRVQGQVGVFWSNQNTKRFGFRTHTNGQDASVWSADELPASQSALDVGYGFGDDHMNIKMASDGTLYCASKTSYDTPGYPKLILLKRNPNGAWDNVYEVTQSGTRGIVLLSETVSKLYYIYTQQEDGGDILYRESSMSNIAFGQEQLLINGLYNNPTSTKENFGTETVILASDLTQIIGVKVTASHNVATLDTPALISPVNNAITSETSVALTWSTVASATSYQLQLSTDSLFSNLVEDQSVTSTSLQLSNLLTNSVYFWRVKAVNSMTSSAWSVRRTFTIESATLQPPILLIPANGSQNISVATWLKWSSVESATGYDAEVSTSSDFSTTIFAVSELADTVVLVEGLTDNTTYFWRVRTRNSAGTGSWSAYSTFRTTQYLPLVPLLHSPVDLAVDLVTTPTLRWYASDRAESYHVQLSTTSSFSSLLLDRSGFADTALNANNLSSSTTYYWRVDAVNGAGTSGWSQVWKFTTRAVAVDKLIVADWKFNEGSGNSVNDDSGFQNNGSTINGPVWVNGKSGTALKFNGTNQLAVIPDAPTLNIQNAITVSAWIRPEKKASQHIISKGEPDLYDGYELSLLSTGKFSFRVNQKTSTSLKVNSKSLYPFDGVVWVHVAATYNGLSMKIYVNGKLDKTATFSTAVAINTNSQPLAIAADYNRSSFLKGAIDEVKVYNYELTENEINALATNTSLAGNTTTNETSVGRQAVSIAADLSTSKGKPTVNIYPNPVKQSISIQLLEANDETALTISDLYGHVYYTGMINGSDVATLDTNELGLGKGFYIATIRSKNSIRVIKFRKE